MYFSHYIIIKFINFVLIFYILNLSVIFFFIIFSDLCVVFLLILIVLINKIILF